MDYSVQRKLAVKLFTGKLPTRVVDFIKDHDNCFESILPAMEPYQNVVLAVIKDINIPSEWAYYWARSIGNKDIMLSRMSESD